MNTTRILYVILTLPGLGVAEKLAEHRLTKYCVDAAMFQAATGAPQLALDEAGNLISVASAAGARSAREMFEQALTLRLEAGDPTIVLGGTGKHGLKFLKQLDPALGYTVQLVDFIAPILEENRQQAEWQALQDAMQANAGDGVPVLDWLGNQLHARFVHPPEPFTPQLIAGVAKQLAKQFIYASKAQRATIETQIKAQLNRYQEAPWQDLHWHSQTPDEFFAEIEAPLTFPLPYPRSDFGPTERPLLIIGDVHGDADDLATILAAHPASDITLLGDYFDRGPQNAAVFQLLTLQTRHLHLLCGNHELALRRALVEDRGMGGGLEQTTLDQLAQAGIHADAIRTFMAELGTYRAFKYHGRGYFLCHAGIEKAAVEAWHDGLHNDARIALAPTEAFVYGIRQLDGSAYDRDVDAAWGQKASRVSLDKIVSVHGHRNGFDHTVDVDADKCRVAINLADADTSTLRYLEVNEATYALHIRKRFTDEEQVIEGKL